MQDPIERLGRHGVDHEEHARAASRVKHRLPRANGRRRLQAFGAATSLLFPLLSWPAFLLLGTRGVVGARGWEVLWAAFFGLLAIPALVAGDAVGLLWVCLQGSVGYLTCRLFSAPLRLVGPSLMVAVAAIVAGAAVEATIYERTWKAAEEPLREEVEWSSLWGVDRVSRPETYRLWDLPEDPGPLRLSFEARWIEGGRGWSWRRSGGDVGMRPDRGRNVIATQLAMPRDGDAWAARDYDVASAVDAVRVRMDLRSSRDGAGNLHLLADGEPVHVQRVDVREGWRRITTTWRPDDSSRPEVVTVVLDDFHDQTLYARNVEVDVTRHVGGEVGTWRSLGLPRQARASMALGQTAVDEDSVGGGRLSFVPTPDWQAVNATFEHEKLDTLAAARTILRVEPETEIALRNVRLEHVDSGAPARAQRVSTRQQLWFGHPNLLGHGVAVAGLVMAATLPIGATGVVGVGLATAAAAYTGSRAALVVLVVGALALWWIRLKGRPKARAMIAILLVLMVVGGATYVFVSGEAREEAGQPRRAAIALAAVEAIGRAPWTGMGGHPDAFAEVWQELGTSDVPVVHAHNWWLQFGLAHGLAGLVAATWFSLALLAIGWRHGRWRGAVLVMAVLALQVFDVTLLHWAVLSPLALTLNALAGASGSGGARQVRRRSEQNCRP